MYIYHSKSVAVLCVLEYCRITDQYDFAHFMIRFNHIQNEMTFAENENNLVYSHHGRKFKTYYFVFELNSQLLVTKNYFKNFCYLRLCSL